MGVTGKMRPSVHRCWLLPLLVLLLATVVFTINLDRPPHPDELYQTFVRQLALLESDMTVKGPEVADKAQHGRRTDPAEAPGPKRSLRLRKENVNFQPYTLCVLRNLLKKKM